jgi:cytochrome c peroxidase
VKDGSSSRSGVLPALPLAIVLLSGVSSAMALPPVPVPAENPITEEKRVLGKILFWDEQLSSSNTMACATCHIPARGGTDGRIALNPGNDGLLNTPDDVLGSVGVIKSQADGTYVRDALFALRPQVTGKSAPSMINAAYAPSLFWDGRATGKFKDPITNEVLIEARGALESQAAGPPTSSVEMSHTDINWTDVAEKIARSRPLDLATNLPADVALALTGEPSYPVLFQRAFGDPAVTPARIAFAIATYERTLIADDTPFDRFEAGQLDALTPNQQEGWIAFQVAGCVSCHTQPLFSDQRFRNIGVRPAAEDAGRAAVTGNPADQGKVKTPGLRNVSLKRTYMHTGRMRTLQEVMDFYGRVPGAPPLFEDNLDPLMDRVVLNPGDSEKIIDLMENGFLDQRVADETFPFDRPVLQSENNLRESTSMAVGGVAGQGGVVPVLIADSTSMIGNMEFRIGLDGARGGSQAWLLVCEYPPINGVLPAQYEVGPISTPGIGPGTGFATAFWPLVNGRYDNGQMLYMQWAVSDSDAPGGVAYSDVMRVPLFCGRAGCRPACDHDLNRDGVTNINDAQALAGMVVGLTSYEAGWLDGDVNSDENVDMSDAQAIARFVVTGVCGV